MLPPTPAMADVWDHVVHVNWGNADRIATRPGLRLHGYKGWIEEAGDLGDPEAVRRFMERPERMIFCRDPAEIVRLLGRQPEDDPPPIPDAVRAWIHPAADP